VVKIIILGTAALFVIIGLLKMFPDVVRYVKIRAT